MFRNDYYLNKSIESLDNKLIKVITGIQRCDKSFLLNNIFYDFLIKEWTVDFKCIIRFAFDNFDNIGFEMQS